MSRGKMNPLSLEIDEADGPVSSPMTIHVSQKSGSPISSQKSSPMGSRPVDLGFSSAGTDDDSPSTGALVSSSSRTWMRRSSQEKQMIRHIKDTNARLEKYHRAEMEKKIHEFEQKSRKTVHTYRLRKKDEDDNDQDLWGHTFDVPEIIRQSRAALHRSETEVLRKSKMIRAKDILGVLPEEDLLALKDEFIRQGELDKDQFTTTLMNSMMNALPELGVRGPGDGLVTSLSTRDGFEASASWVSCEGREEEVDRLWKEINILFTQIDYDSNGSLDWEEFTNYMMYLHGAASSAGKVQTAPGGSAMAGDEEDILFSSNTSTFVSRHAGGKSSIRLCSDRGGTLHTLEQFDNYTRLSLFQSNVNVPGVDVCTAAAGMPPRPGGRKKLVTQVQLDPTVSCVEYVDQLDQYAVMDHRWTVKLYGLQHNPDQVGGRKLVKNHECQILQPSLIARYSAASEQMVTGTTAGEIVVYPLSQMQGMWTPEFTLKCHQEPISALYQVPRTNRIISASIFGGLNAIDRGRSEGNTLLEIAQADSQSLGIHSMIFLPETNLLVTGGHSPELMMWMVVQGAKDPRIGMLSDATEPHRHGVIDLWHDTVTDPNLVVSTDLGGMMKMWDLRKMRCVTSTYTIPGKKGETLFHAADVAADSSTGSLFVFGTSVNTHMSSIEEVKLLPRHEIHRQEEEKAMTAPTLKACVFDEANEMVISAVNSDVIIYEWRTGIVASYFSNVVPGLITALAPDHKGRRIYLGTSNGRVLVLNSTIGSITYEFQAIQGEISFLIATQDALIAGGTSGLVYVFDLECSSAVPSSTFYSSERLTAAAYHQAAEIVIFGNAQEVIHTCEIKGSKVNGAGDSVFKRQQVNTNALRLPPTKQGDDQSQAAAEINFQTDKHLYEMLAEPRGEITAATSLAPCAGFVVADTTSHLCLQSTKPLLPMGMLCARWEHYTPRSIMNNGLVQNIVLSISFYQVRAPAPDPAPKPTGMLGKLLRRKASLPTAQSFLVTGDDQGCVVLWDMTELLESTNIVDPNGGGQPPEDSSGQSPLADVMASTVLPTVKHCFLVAKGVPVVTVKYIERDDVLLCGLATGSCKIMSTEGALLATFHPHPKFKNEPPPNWNFVAGAKEAAHKHKAAAGGRTNALWDKMKRSVIGGRATLAAKLMQVVKDSKRTAMDVLHEDDDSDIDAETPRSLNSSHTNTPKSEDLATARTEREERSGEASYRVADPTLVPCCSPREHNLDGRELKMKVDCVQRTGNVVVPQFTSDREYHRHIANVEARKRGTNGANDDDDTEDYYYAESASPSIGIDSTPHLTPLPSSLLNRVTPSDVDRITMKLESVRQKAKKRKRSKTSLAPSAQDPDGVEVQYKSLILYEPSIAGALSAPMAYMLPVEPLSYQPDWVTALAETFVGGEVITPNVLVNSEGRPQPVMSQFFEAGALDPDDEHLDMLRVQLSLGANSELMMSPKRKAQLLQRQEDNVRRDNRARDQFELLQYQRAKAVGARSAEASMTVAATLKDKWKVGLIPQDKPVERLGDLLPEPKGPMIVLMDIPASAPTSPVDRESTLQTNTDFTPFGSESPLKPPSGSSPSTTSTTKPSNRDGSITSDAAAGGGSFQELLALSAPAYPLQESPYLTPGRPTPALSPYLFSGERPGSAPLPLPVADLSPPRAQANTRLSVTSSDGGHRTMLQEQMAPQARFARALNTIGQSSLPKMHPDFVEAAHEFSTRDIQSDEPLEPIIRPNTTIPGLRQRTSSLSNHREAGTVRVDLRVPSHTTIKKHHTTQPSSPHRQQQKRTPVLAGSQHRVSSASLVAQRRQRTAGVDRAGSTASHYTPAVGLKRMYQPLDAEVESGRSSGFMESLGRRTVLYSAPSTAAGGASLPGTSKRDSVQATSDTPQEESVSPWDVDGAPGEASRSGKKTRPASSSIGGQNTMRSMLIDIKKYSARNEPARPSSGGPRAENTTTPVKQIQRSLEGSLLGSAERQRVAASPGMDQQRWKEAVSTQVVLGEEVGVAIQLPLKEGPLVSPTKEPEDRQFSPTLRSESDDITMGSTDSGLPPPAIERTNTQPLTPSAITASAEKSEDPTLAPRASSAMETRVASATPSAQGRSRPPRPSTAMAAQHTKMFMMDPKVKDVKTSARLVGNKGAMVSLLGKRNSNAGGPYPSSMSVPTGRPATPGGKLKKGPTTALNDPSLTKVDLSVDARRRRRSRLS